jgi:hypothetical protein
MIEREMPAAQKPEMSREQLVRAHFEAHCDLAWAEALGPKFNDYRMGANSMAQYRGAWNAFVKSRDWAWWQDEVKDSSNAELEKERTECLDKIKTLGAQPRQRDTAVPGGPAFHDILNREESAGERRAEPMPTLTKGNDI